MSMSKETPSGAADVAMADLIEPAPIPLPPVGVARLENGVYQGFDVFAADAAPLGAVLVPPDCDLAPGRYTWNAIDQRFDPLWLNAGGIEAPVDVQATQVLALVVAHLAQTAGAPFDARVVQWFNAYRSTVDAPAGLPIITPQGN